MSPSRKMVAPMARKTELDSLEGREPNTSTAVLRSEELTWEGVPPPALVGVAGRAASAESIPGNVAPSESIANLGFSLEPSAFETAVVSGAPRGVLFSCLVIDAHFFAIALSRLEPEWRIAWCLKYV